MSDADWLAAVGRAVRRRRRALGLTQAQLAVAAGMGPRTLAGLERGRRNPSLVAVHRLARVLGAGLGELADDGGDA